MIYAQTSLYNSLIRCFLVAREYGYLMPDWKQQGSQSPTLHVHIGCSFVHLIHGKETSYTSLCGLQLRCTPLPNLNTSTAEIAPYPFIIKGMMVVSHRKIDQSIDASYEAWAMKI
jgi:hypothetical protein